MKWEYVQVTANNDDNSAEWAIAILMPSGEIQRLNSGPRWPAEVSNDLGRDGWELVARNASKTEGQYVVGWTLLFKRPSGP